MNTMVRAAGVLLAAAFLGTFPAAAQIPDKFENLQVLPKDISKRDLIDTMKSFCSALGTRCVKCHVGKPDGSLDGMDFKSDEKDDKLVARAMIRMTRAINADYIAKLDQENPIQVGCVTCHRGVGHPTTIDNLMSRVIERRGVDAAVTRYRELREQHYGDGAYDFTEGPLNDLGERLVGSNAANAIAILKLNLEYHPDSAIGHFMLGEAYRATDDKASARTEYTRALELAPDNPRAKKRLEELGPAPTE